MRQRKHSIGLLFSFPGHWLCSDNSELPYCDRSYHLGFVTLKVITIASTGLLFTTTVWTSPRSVRSQESQNSMPRNVMHRRYMRREILPWYTPHILLSKRVFRSRKGRSPPWSTILSAWHQELSENELSTLLEHIRLPLHASVQWLDRSRQSKLRE